jgi:hypothetical protein
MLRATASLIASAAVVVLAGCGGDGGDSGGGRLADALSSVSAGPAGEQAFLWTDVAAVRQAGDFSAHTGDMRLTPAQRPWLTPLGTGAPRLANAGVTVRDQLGIDLLSADQAITIGNAPESAVRLDGVDAAPAHDSLSKLPGAKAGQLGDRAIITRGDERQVDLDGDASQLLIGIGNRFYAKDGTVALSGTDAALQGVLGDGGDPLGDQPAYAAAADCLGDVVSAEIHPGRDAGTEAALVAIGARGDATPTEVLCVVGDEDRADAAAQTLRKRMTPDAITPDTRQPLSDLVAGTDVSTGGSGDEHYARAVLTLADERPLGFLTQALQRRALVAYLGG